MRISVVTISFNQARFLRQCIDSVLSQDYYDLEYIIVDPGSVDGSREIIQDYGDRVIRVFEPDDGPADGLNKGFALATGDLFCYLNSDDMFLPPALSTVASFLEGHPKVDVVCGHGRVINESGAAWRRVYSDSFSLDAVAYGACTVVQPSTFFRAELFRRVNGFNTENRCNWDGELLVDMALAGARIASLNAFLSCYRVHGGSITGTGRLDVAHKQYSLRQFREIKGRSFKRSDHAYSFAYRLLKHGRHPCASWERLRHGPIYRSA